MPAVAHPAKVLVTGANGYIASWVVLTLLDRGHSVRGSVRSAEKGEELKNSLQKRVPTKVKNFEYVVIPDVCKAGTFDEAVHDVDAVAHTAPHPVTHTFDDPLELMDPCIKGTVGVLESMLTNGKKVKRLLFLSSDVASRTYGPTEHIFDENDWNDAELLEAQENIRSHHASNFPPVYSASKVLSERAVWDFHERHKQDIGWDVVVFNPSLVYGPLANDKLSPEDLTTSISGFWFYMCSSLPTSVPVVDYFAKDRHYVDVRDVAELHARALEKEEAGGHRFIVTAGDLNWNDWLDIARSLTPKFPGLRPTPIGPPPGTPSRVKLANSKAKDMFGIEYKDAAEIVRDTLQDFHNRGWKGIA